VVIGSYGVLLDANPTMIPGFEGSDYCTIR